jgi:hypothetical protein
MGLNKRLIGAGATASGGLTPSEHFGVVLYEGDGKSGRSVNGGKFGGAAAFGIEKSSNQATDSRITTTYYAKNVGSISGWLKKNGNTSELEYIFVTKDDTGSSHQLGINLMQEADSDLSARVGNGSSTTNVNTSGLTLNNDAWHHFVVTWNLPNSTNNVKVYIDGSLSSTGSQTTGSWTGNSSRTFQLGHYTNTNTNNGFSGMLDQVRVFEKELSSSQVSTLYAETAATVESLDPLNVDTTDTLQVLGDTSCIATYRFENDEIDLSGNYNGTGTAIQYAAGRYGQAASFNGSSAYINAGYIPTAASNTFSISTWVMFNSISASGTIAATYVSGSGNLGWYLRFSTSSKLEFGYTDGTQQSVSNSFTPNTGQWYHVVVTVGSNNVILYINGTQNASLSSTTISYTGNPDLYLGKLGTLSSSYLDGKIDQVRVFNKAISAAEVTTLYNENPLVASYRFEGNSNDDMRTYDGTASNVTYEYGLEFTPDFVWIKNRTGSADHHSIIDSSRGTASQIFPNLTNAQNTYTDQLTSFDSGGFTVEGFQSSEQGRLVNVSGDEYVAWCFKANGGTTSSNTDGTITSTVQVNEQAGFSIVKYTGNNSASQTYGHGLNAEPKLIITKRISGGNAQNWCVWHTGLTSENYFLYLNTTAAEGDGIGTAFNSGISSSLVGIGNSGLVNDPHPYISYCFAEVEGFSSFGSYTGNGSTNGPIVETGFEPAFVIIKNTTSADNWAIYDNKRNTVNSRTKILLANSNAAEATEVGAVIDFLSNGFQSVGTGGGGGSGQVNKNANTYIYMAFAADPDTEAPTVAKSFSTVAYTGNGGTQSIDALGFKPNLVWIKSRTDAVDHCLLDSVRGDFILTSNKTVDQEVGNGGIVINNDGFTVKQGVSSTTDGEVNVSGKNYVAWTWKADDNEPTIFGGSAIAVYKFEDNANDVTGTYNGTASNISYTSSGKFNKAAEFNGSSSYISNTSISGFPSGASSRTLSFWVNVEGSGVRVIGGYGNSSTAQYFGLSVGTTNKINFLGYGYNQETTYTIPQNEWVHIVTTYDGGTQRLYANGSQQYSIARTYNTVNTELRIGDDLWGTTERFDGKIDQVRIYNGAISDIDVAELYAETVSDNDDLNLGGPPEILVSANANAGFSIVKYTGSGANAKVPHGLSAAPEMIFIKNLDSATNWNGWTPVSGVTNYISLNSTNELKTTSGSSGFSNGVPTSTVVNLDGSSWSNESGSEHIMYCWHSVAGYSKFGSYTGTGTTNSITGLGFQPDWLMIKRATGGSSNGWVICDSVRGVGVNLRADTSGAEADESAYTTSFDSDGFTLAQAGGNTNVSGSTYIYMAFKIN